jgi:hypothetical protein
MTSSLPLSALVRCLTVPVVLAGSVATVRADLRFVQPQVNVGEVRSGVPLAHNFPFVNDGPGTVEITAVRTGCGCLTSRLEKRLYPPGEQGALRVEINTLGQSAGAHTWRAYVTVRNNNVESEQEVNLTGLVVTEVTVQPASLTICAGGTVRAEVVLTDLRPQPLSIKAVRTSSPRLAAEPAAPCRDALGHWTCKIPLRVAADCPDGRFDEVLTIYTSDLTYRDLKVPVTLVKRARPRVAALPAEVTLTAPAGQALPARVVLLRAGDDRPVEVESVTVDDPAIRCQWARGPENLATLKVQVNRAGLHGGRLDSAVHVRIRSPAEEILTIPVHCAEP